VIQDLSLVLTMRDTDEEKFFLEKFPNFVSRGRSPGSAGRELIMLLSRNLLPGDLAHAAFAKESGDFM
jgi:hypothetical protein